MDTALDVDGLEFLLLIVHEADLSGGFRFVFLVRVLLRTVLQRTFDPQWSRVEPREQVHDSAMQGAVG